MLRMNKVTLLFQTEKDLRRFHMIIVECGQVEMNLKKLTLLCHCDERDIQIAVKGFNATIIE